MVPPKLGSSRLFAEFRLQLIRTICSLFESVGRNLVHIHSARVKGLLEAECQRCGGVR